MHVAIIGAAGMIGKKLAQAISETGKIGSQDVTKLSLYDVTKPQRPSKLIDASTANTVDISDSEDVINIVSSRPDVIFHLAAIVSSEAETNFEKGYAINLDGTRALFDEIHKETQRIKYFPKVIFTSSLAVFGAPLPAKIPDTFFTTPLTSYGTQKAIGEMLLADYTRKGIFDGIGLRLPTIVVRPGKPNKAASSFFSGIIREPLSGLEAVLPVSDSVRHWFTSPRSAVRNLIHAAQMDLTTLGARRNLTMPGLSATVGEEIEALRRVAGEDAVKMIRREADPLVEKIVLGWPADFEASQAKVFGFIAEQTFDEIIQVYIEDELGGSV